MKTYALALLAIVLLTAAGIFVVARPRAPLTPPPVVVTTVSTGETKRPPREPAQPVVSSVTAENTPDTTPPAPGPGVRPPLAEHGIAPAPPPEERLLSTDGDEAGANTPFATERAEIHLLAASNNPGNVVPLARYLEHADAGVREEARNGLIMLGAKSGAPFLSAAAAKSADPAESELLKEAAEFLANPPPPPAPEPAGDEPPPSVQ